MWPRVPGVPGVHKALESEVVSAYSKQKSPGVVVEERKVGGWVSLAVEACQGGSVVICRDSLPGCLGRLASAVRPPTPDTIRSRWQCHADWWKAMQPMHTATSPTRLAQRLADRLARLPHRLPHRLPRAKALSLSTSTRSVPVRGCCTRYSTASAHNAALVQQISLTDKDAPGLHPTQLRCTAMHCAASEAPGSAPTPT